MKKFFAFLAVAAILIAPQAHASFGPIATTGDLAKIQSQINDIASQVEALQAQAAQQNLGGSFSNPTTVTSSTVAAALPQPLGTTATPTFGTITVGGNATATISGNANTVSYIPVLTGGVNLPSPTQLAASGGVTCGTTAGVTDGVLCLNDIYAANTTASSTVVNVGPFTYNSANTIQINTLGERMTVQCQQGASVFHYTATTTTPFLSLNAEAAGIAGPLVNTHPGTYGFFGCELQGPGNTTVVTTTIGLQFGGTNGAEGAMFAYGKIDGFGTNVTYGSGAWKTALLYNDISSGYVLLNYPNGLTDSGEANTADHNNFHDSTQTVGTSTYVNAVTIKGGGYFDMEFDNFDDAQFKNTGTGTVRMVNPYFENPGNDANQANYVPIVNAPGALSDVLMMTNPFFTEDGTTASGTPTAFITNNNGTIYVNDFGVLKNGAGTVTSFFTNAGSGNFSLCNGVGQGSPWTHFNGTDDSQTFTISGSVYLMGCSQSVANNWPTGWVSLGNNIFGVTDGGIVQEEISPAGMGFATSSVSVTNATVVGNNNSGVFTTTGGTTAFTLTFSTAFTFKPNCFAQMQSPVATTTVLVASPVTTSTLFTSSASLPVGTKVGWICNGDPY